MADLPPIRRQVVVPSTADVAFAVFTDHIGQWWPLADLSVYGKEAEVAFRDGRLVEHGPDGAEALWGTVLDWEPPHRLRLTWHPGAGADRATEVEVSFVPVTDDLTMVTVEHRGWERLGAPGPARRDRNRAGWDAVLPPFIAAATNA